VLASARLAEAIEEIVKPIKLVLVISTSADKKHKQMMADLAPIADYIIAARHSVMGRALDPQLIADEARALGKPCEVVEDIKLAVMKAAAKAGREGTVLVTGSVFTVGEARDIWFPEKPVWGREMNETRGRK
jgi:dihydrofolate synthase/folylpolyglutamate synthase